MTLGILIASVRAQNCFRFKGSKSKSLPFFKPTSVCDSQNLTQYSNWNNQNASKGIEDTFTVLKYLEELSLNLILNCLQ